MSLPALALLLAAAILHMSWNLLIKRSGGRQVFAWWGLLVGAVCFTPLLLLTAPLPLSIWPYLVLSAIVEAVYFTALTFAYDLGDFSLVYPMARGAAPAFLTLWSVLFLDEHPSAFGYVGLAILLLGLVVVGSGAWAQRGAVPVSLGAVGAALAVAASISVYSAIDGYAVRHADPAAYTIAVLSLTSVLATPATWWRYGRVAVMGAWRGHWPRIIVAGVMGVLAYLLVLQVYAIDRVSYAGAIREVSIVFAAFVGWRWLGEGFGATRLLGSGLIFAGILVIVVAG